MFIRPMVTPSGSVPETMPNLALWLDASDIDTLYQTGDTSTPVTTDGQNVMYWADKSGNGCDVISPAGKQCYYKASATMGLGAVEGRTANDGYFYTATKALTQTEYVTVFAVFYKTETNAQCLWSTCDTVAQGLKLFTAENVTQTNRRSMEMYDSAGLHSSYVTNNFTLNSWHQVTGFADKDILQVNNRQDGADGYRGLTTGDFVIPNSATRVMNHYSTQSSFKGYLAELILYDGLLTSTQQGTVEAYMKAKWGTP